MSSRLRTCLPAIPTSRNRVKAWHPAPERGLQSNPPRMGRRIVATGGAKRNPWLRIVPINFPPPRGGGSRCHGYGTSADPPGREWTGCMITGGSVSLHPRLRPAAPPGPKGDCEPVIAKRLCRVPRLHGPRSGTGRHVLSAAYMLTHDPDKSGSRESMAPSNPDKPGSREGMAPSAAPSSCADPRPPVDTVIECR